jgi:hypothetical protein
LRIEHCFVFNAKSEKIFHKTSGLKDGVFFETEELFKIQGARLFIHNHPSGDSFSSPDLRFLFENEISEMRVVSDRQEYRLRLKKTVEDDDVDEIVNNYKKILEEIVESLEKRNIPKDDIDKVQYSLSMEKFMSKNKTKEIFSYETRKI